MLSFLLLNRGFLYFINYYYYYYFKKGEKIEMEKKKGVGLADAVK